MSADLINLRRARKAKARSAREQAAEENRTLHGRTRAQKERDGRARADAVRQLEGHRREPPEKP